MSLPELIPSNLPQFVRLTPRSAFANSVVPQGCALYFAEPDGSGAKFLYKNPDGSYTEVGGGGGGSMNFYKCASVGAGTWSGYLASVDSTTGVWSFASTATTGLTYDRITPVVGRVYDEFCTFVVKNYKTDIPSRGLLFYLPLDEKPGHTDETGKTLSYLQIEELKFATYQGISCMQCKNTALIGGPDFSSLIPNDGGGAFTLSCWISSPYTNSVVVGFNKNVSTSIGYMTGLYATWDEWQVKNDGTYIFTPNDFMGSGLRHVLITFGANTVTLYVDGEYFTQGAFAVTDKPFGSQTVWVPFVGCRDGGNERYLARFRVYNRVLDAGEIAALAAELSPTPLS